MSAFLAEAREPVFPSQQPLRRLARGQFPGLAHSWDLASGHWAPVSFCVLFMSWKIFLASTPPSLSSPIEVKRGSHMGNDPQPPPQISSPTALSWHSSEQLKASGKQRRLGGPVLQPGAQEPAGPCAQGVIVHLLGRLWAPLEAFRINACYK